MQGGGGSWGGRGHGGVGGPLDTKDAAQPPVAAATATSLPRDGEAGGDSSVACTLESVADNLTGVACSVLESVSAPFPPFRLGGRQHACTRSF